MFLGSHNKEQNKWMSERTNEKTTTTTTDPTITDPAKTTTIWKYCLQFTGNCLQNFQKYFALDYNSCYFNKISCFEGITIRKFLWSTLVYFVLVVEIPSYKYIDSFVSIMLKTGRRDNAPLLCRWAVEDQVWSTFRSSL